MRYSMLVTITDMSRTLLEAAQYLASAPAEDMRAELLDNGRRMMGQIRDVLERHSGDLRTTLPLERLWKIGQLWGGGEHGALEETLEEFIRKLPEEVSYQVRAVFFAELGEKWDAMESVYEYMRNDPRFDPVVVRTPVGRVVMRDGKKEQEIIYKDFLTPMGIPSLGYDQYSLEEDCPELAFISQPYESCTLREFWPETIAKVTRLVYLPYFLPSIVLSDYPTVLCQMPVYNVAWKVIGANKKHFDYYCKHSRHGGANMLVTGVPKMDPVIRLKKEGISLPSGWEKIRGKKVVLWNSWFDIAVSSFRFFKEIFSWFEIHEDCALIWRPHPMTETVVKLYFPEQYSYWENCIKKVQNMANAVLDTESSYLPAFACSDAQISDHSSLMQQYLLMDKPLLWINTLATDLTGEEFVSTKWMERADNAEEVICFLDQIRFGKDATAEVRKSIIQKDIPFADGRCGERVCRILWEKMLIEDALKY